MNAQVVNFSLPTKLLKLADRVAQNEARTRSELFREAIRVYLLRRAAWDELFVYGERKAKKLNLKEEDIDRLVAEYRHGK
ncbi:hypothetical protein A3A79_02165 [Candidatus Gottesmanbacteria bacterium RIFCSPLOWO2_01_FULL_43_11b]|uniref:Ribbon-helix-helix protein CopG domain-containing protein n=1 Tax=Candidatus Gottesmanbacteria bacterium RIFCSPLOWO2_01_FULL_43_11b TaxID=1798392 RepID=A0A1F6AH21_9BACT|nr:MAG: hypothetical protein A3A79_02165 [Candidatus Gottesmanbacteria bacterium RIFCSPLOWO2_01_FULL_43_11b]